MRIAGCRGDPYQSQGGSRALEKKSSFIVLLVVVAVLTLIIAALVSFIFLIGINVPASADGGGNGNGNGNGNAGGKDANAFTLSAEPPDESLLATVQLFDSAQALNLMTDNPLKPSYGLIEVSIKYFIKVEGIKDVHAKIILNKANLQEIVNTYFMAMSVDEFSRFETKARVKNDLKQELNEFLLTTIAGEKERRKANEIIYDVMFSTWNYQ
jgi:flagellar basal body-associated protein FliL